VNSMNILDLGPAEFLAALDELGVAGEQRDALIAQYSDPSRGYERDQRPFLTRLGDNVIGFDDGVETQGERIGQGVRTFFDAVRSDPLGTAGDMISGLYGEIQRGVRGELSPTETLGLAPVVGFGSAAARRAEDVVDTAQRAQAARFQAETTPVFPGEPWATDARREAQFYHPSSREESVLSPQLAALTGASPTAPQQEFARRRTQARQELAQGQSREDIAYRTGILSLPRQTYTGDRFRDRQVAAVTPSGMLGLRPDRATEYGVQRTLDPDLPAGHAYASLEPGKAPVIGHSPQTPAADLPAIDRHEMTHVDLFMGDVPYDELGSNAAFASAARRDALDTLNRRIREADTPEERQRLMALREEIQRATSYELYQRNPGEMLSRLAQGLPTTSRALSLTEALNPYIRPEAGFGQRASDTFEQAFRGERAGIFSVPVTRALDYFGVPVDRRLYFDTHKDVPMDLSRALFPDP
jgi:hypothetical protein